jgi:hypothetical protein
MIIDEDILLDAARNGPAMTFEEIGSDLGVTKERAFQIYQAAIAKVRKNMTPEYVEEFNHYLEQTAGNYWEEIELQALDISDQDNLRGFWREEHNVSDVREKQLDMFDWTEEEEEAFKDLEKRISDQEWKEAFADYYDDDEE